MCFAIGNEAHLNNKTMCHSLNNTNKPNEAHCHNHTCSVTVSPSSTTNNINTNTDANYIYFYQQCIQHYHQQTANGSRANNDVCNQPEVDI